MSFAYFHCILICTFFTPCPKNQPLKVEIPSSFLSSFHFIFGSRHLTERRVANWLNEQIERQTNICGWPFGRLGEERGSNIFADTSNKASTAVLEGLEKVADYCDKLDIALVKINDLELVSRLTWFTLFNSSLFPSGDRIQPGGVASVGLLSAHHSHSVRRTTWGWGWPPGVADPEQEQWGRRGRHRGRPVQKPRGDGRCCGEYCCPLLWVSSTDLTKDKIH